MPRPTSTPARRTPSPGWATARSHGSSSDWRKENPGDGEPLVAMAEGVLLARSGDPELAEVRLREAPTHGVDPREFWRISLFRALAAFRRGSCEAGALAARAFEEASRLGLGHLPLTKERAVTEQLLGLAIETGQPAALALEVTVLPTAIRVLGTFSLTSGGREVPLSPGQPRQLLKVLAVSGGRLVSDQMIDALWPEADVDAGRNRLRTVLNRLRAEAGDVVGREGEMLALRLRRERGPRRVRGGCPPGARARQPASRRSRSPAPVPPSPATGAMSCRRIRTRSGRSVRETCPAHDAAAARPLCRRGGGAG